MMYSREKQVTKIIRESLYGWRLYTQAVKASTRGDWKLAEEYLDDLYSLAGFVNEYTGYTFACGWHPLQQWAKEEFRDYNRSRL